MQAAYRRLLCLGHFAQAHALKLPVAENAPVESACRVGADDHFTGLGDRLHAGSDRGGRPCDDELAVAPANQVEIEASTMGSDRDAEGDSPGRGPQPTDSAHHLRHEDSSSTGTRWRGRLREEEKRGVPTPLQQVRSITGGDTEHLGEDRADDIGDLLRTYLAPSRQPLGEGCEAGDVHEQQRAFEVTVRRLGRVGQPLESHARGT